MSLPIFGKKLYAAVFYYDFVIKNPGTSFFPKKKRLRQCITHTQGIKIPGTSFFPNKKAPAAVHHTHTGHTNPRNAIFSEKKAPAAVHHTHTGHKNTRNPGTADITNGSGYFCDVMPWPLIGFGMDL